ncbi:MAG: hypothetical protein MO846_06175 [Candidatus Devosia symbiotica]|nr:hypothetical protein [Candidatus Devosia symbiotica]
MVAGYVAARPVLLEFLTDLWVQTRIAPEQTLLVGFSQSAMMALHVGLSLPQRLMGIVAFSGALLPPEGFCSATTGHSPVCLVHGDADSVVDPERSADTDVALRLAGYDVVYHISPGGRAWHCVKRAGICQPIHISRRGKISSRPRFTGLTQKA